MNTATANIKSTRVDDLIARISGELSSGKFTQGAFLGTQQELCERYRVSTPVLVQAVRVLTYRGLVEIRAGNSGGLYAGGLSLRHCGKRMATYLEYVGTDYRDAAPVSRLLQELVVRSATASLTHSSVRQIRETIARIDCADYFDRSRLLSTMFQQFAEATTNPILALFYRVITDVMLDLTTIDHFGQGPDMPRDHLVELGLAVADGVIAADHQRSGRAFTEFADALFEKLEANLPAPAKATASHPPFDASRTARGKLPERLAAHILQEIRERRWPTGTRLGSEPELLARYGVSRATLRQTTRLLEEYAAVETKRGPGGGVVITAPNSTQITESALALLRQHHTSQAQAVAVLEPLATLALEQVLTLASDEQRNALAEHISSLSVKLSPSPAEDINEVLAKLTSTVNMKVLGLFFSLLGLMLTSTPPPYNRLSQLWEYLARAVSERDTITARGVFAEIIRHLA